MATLAAKLIARIGAAVVVLLVVQRVAYHASYLADDPFALATFSDGQLYERAAVDLVDHPPWGRRPFYLQGIYAVLLALPMRWWPGPAMGLLLQLSLVAVGLFVFHRACRSMYGRQLGTGCTVALLAYPGLSFYENKYLTAGLAEVSLCLMLGALAWARTERRPRAALAFGLATGLSILVRGNMALGVPAFALAMLALGRHHHGRGRRTVAAWALGVALALAPMAVRNAVVTGSPTVFPAHGGGTSFYIGNNAHAKGLWNTAGGLLSGDVGRERDELVDQLGIDEDTEAEQAAAIGAALYRRAFEEIAADPGRWGRLQAKKAWLLIGDQELSQDYDALGEAELVGHVREWGIPFSVLLALGLCGGWALRRDCPELGQAGLVGAGRRAWLWTLGGMAVAVVGANILFFTSAQHRAPLAVVLAAVAAPGARWVLASGRDASLPGWRRLAPIALVCLVVAQGAWTRARVHERPSAAHYHNLALVEVELGRPRAAVITLSLALRLDPQHPVIRIERASLFRRLGYLDRAQADLDVLAGQTGHPKWVRVRAAQERRRVAALVGLRRSQE